MKGVDPTARGLEIRCAENGWVVLTGLEFDRGAIRTAYVARTPKELADLMMTWAQAQNDMPNSNPPRQP